MSQRDPNGPGRPRNERRDRILLILAVTIAAALVLALAVSLIIHFVLLGTDQFNWLEAPKRSDLLSPMRAAPILPAKRGEDAAAGRSPTPRPADS